MCETVKKITNSNYKEVFQISNMDIFVKDYVGINTLTVELEERIRECECTYGQEQHTATDDPFIVLLKALNSISSKSSSSCSDGCSSCVLSIHNRNILINKLRKNNTIRRIGCVRI